MKQLKSHFLILLGILLSISCNKEDVYHEYKCEVSGTYGDYNITYTNITDNLTQQWNNVGNDWSYSWTQTGVKWLCISAQNNSKLGYVTVRIMMDGKVVESKTSDYGEYMIAKVCVYR